MKPKQKSKSKSGGVTKAKATKSAKPSKDKKPHPLEHYHSRLDAPGEMKKAKITEEPTMPCNVETNTEARCMLAQLAILKRSLELAVTGMEAAEREIVQ